MIVKKIGVTTGEPFAETGCIVLKGDGDFYNMYRESGYWGGQYSSSGKGVRPATLEEIKSNWSAIQDQWDPQPGDLVRVTQGSFANGHDYVINEPFKDDLNYWRVSYLDGSPYNVFDKNQMVLSPNHGWEANSTPEAVTEPQPRWKAGNYVTYKFHKDCKDQKYSYGGSCQGGYKGEIISYGNYGSVFNCFTIVVMTRDGSSFTMLECEFEEWDNPNFQNSIKPEPVIDKKVEFTIKDGVLKFDGHEVRVGDIVSFNYPSDNKKANDRFIVNQQVLNVETNTYVGSLPFRTDSQWFNIHKVKNFVNYAQPAQFKTISDIKDSLQLIDSRLTINDVYYPPLLINPIKKEKSVSDYQQKPVTLYKPKTKLSLKPIKL